MSRRTLYAGLTGLALTAGFLAAVAPASASTPDIAYPVESYSGSLKLLDRTDRVTDNVPTIDILLPTSRAKVRTVVEPDGQRYWRGRPAAGTQLQLPGRRHDEDG